jgi:transcriptional regulator with XRE-family HTH domain
MKKFQKSGKLLNPLKKLRQNRGLSQRKAALMIGVGPGSWNNWEKQGASARLSIAQILKIEEVFGIRWSDLFIEAK